MDTYNVYFDVKEGVDEARVMALAVSFAKTLVQIIEGYDIHEIKDKARFPQLLAIQMVVYFQSAAEIAEAFTLVRSEYLNQHPHAALMASV